MAKKQVFGEQVLAARASQRKMAKVIISKKSTRGKVAFQETIIEQDQVKDFVTRNKS